jgi:integrase
LSVNRTLHRPKEGVIFGEPKSESSRQTVNLPMFAVATLRQHRVSQRKERLKAGGEWQEQSLVFTTPIGTPLDYSNWRGELRAILRSAGLPMMRIHDLRHTCASLLLASPRRLRAPQRAADCGFPAGLPLRRQPS